MYLKEYLGKESRNRRLLVTEDVSRGNSLIRSYEKETGKQIENITCVSLKSIANQLYLYYEAEKGYTPEYEIIDDTAAMMLLRSVMFDNLTALSYFGDEKMLTEATCREINNKLNLVRGCGWNSNEDSKNVRVKDFKLLTEEFEKRLKLEKFLDYNALLDYLLDETGKGNAEFEVKTCFNAEISYIKEDTENYSLKENNILKKLALLTNSEDAEISVWEKAPSKNVLDETSSKLDFFKGFGSFNEASYIANDILSNNYPLGDVCVLYTNENQLDAISSAFGGNDIKASYTSDRSLKDNMYVALARRILAWAKDDFSEKALEKIYDSPALRNEYVDAATGNTLNAVSGKSYFNHVLSARARRNDGFNLGWGYERNLEFVDHEEKLATDERIKKALEIHKDLLNIFGEKGKLYDGANAREPKEIYEKLIKFLWKYQNKSSDLKDGKGALTNLLEAVKLETRKLSLPDFIEYTDSLLVSLKSSDELSADSVEIALLNNWKHIERKYLYIIGLSLKEMQDNATQSPVLTDKEMEDWLFDGYKPTIENKAELKILNVYRTLSSFKGEKIKFGYSFFNTVLFNESSPSVLYRDALAACNKYLKSVSEFVYGNPISENAQAQAMLSPKEEYPVKLKTSNSSIEILLDCPKKYYYQEIERIPNNEYIEKKNNQWLDAKHYGSLFHYVAQKYIDKVFVKPANELYATNVDENLLLQIIKDETDKMFKAYPAPSIAQKDYEVEQFTSRCKGYFQKVHDVMQADELGWRMLMTEKRFDAVPYSIEDYLGNKYDFLFNGEIDRIDYKIDDSAKAIYIRIIDYKTGKIDKKEQAASLGKVIQHAIYQKAVSVICPEIIDKIAELEDNNKVKGYEVFFDGFEYHFPKEIKINSTNADNKWKFSIPSVNINKLNITRLKVILTALKNMNEYPDHWQLYNEISSYISTYCGLDQEIAILHSNMSTKKGALQKYEYNSCEYCDYKDICPSARGGNI